MKYIKAISVFKPSTFGGMYAEIVTKAKKVWRADFDPKHCLLVMKCIYWTWDDRIKPRNKLPALKHPKWLFVLMEERGWMFSDPFSMKREGLEVMTPISSKVRSAYRSKRT